MPIDQTANTLILPPPQHLEARGCKGLYSTTSSFANRLKQACPELDLFVDKQAQCYLIAQERPPSPGHPEGSLLVNRCYPFHNADGSRFFLGEKIIEELQESRRHRGKEGFQELETQIAKNETKLEAARQVENKAAAQDFARHMALKGMLHSPRVSMYLSKREKKESSK